MVADQMSDDPAFDRKHRPLRWIPIWPIAFACALFILSLTWGSALYFASLGCAIMAWLPSIYVLGPLGRPSFEDDEREAMLRKNSFCFCFGLLASLNCIGQPILMVLSHWQKWGFEHLVSVASAALLLNVALFGSLPTLYASWSLRHLPKE